MEPDIQLKVKVRARLRRRPAWWLRRRARQIAASRLPSRVELVELGEIRQQLAIRGLRSRGWVA